MGAESVLSGAYLGSTIIQYAIFFAVLSAGAVAGRALSFVYDRKVKQQARATETEIDDIVLRALGKPVVLLGVVAAAVVGQTVLTPVDPFDAILASFVEILLVVSIAWIAVRLTDGLIKTYVGGYAERTESRLDDELVPIVSRMTNIAIISISTIVILDSLGYNVNAIIASLGVGGVAVAVASRRTLGDVFGGAHILSAKPFLVEDVVEIDGTAGKVEEIGLRCTILRDFDGRQITLPNSKVANTEVKNISSEPARRVKTFLGLAYGTTPTEMDEALELIRETVNAVNGVDPERTGVWFWEYGDSAMRIRLEYYIEALDEWKAVKDQVNRDIQEAFAAAGYEMALPARAVHVTGDVGPTPGSPAEVSSGEASRREES